MCINILTLSFSVGVSDKYDNNTYIYKLLNMKINKNVKMGKGNQTKRK